jgi:uncharacterized protein (TIGR02231 family)
MKKVLLLICIFMLTVSYAFCEEIAASKIKDVTVFSDKAQIERKGEVTLEEGVHSILVEVPAYYVDASSVQARVFAEGEVFSVQYTEKYLEESPQEKVAELEKLLEEKIYVKNELERVKWVLGKKEKYLDGVITPPEVVQGVDRVTEYPKADDVTQMLFALESSFEEIASTSLETEKKIYELSKEIKVIEQELAGLRQPQSKKKGFIEIVFRSTKKQSVSFEASYLVYQAAWSPFYKVNVSEDLKEISMQMFAQIKQTTGEDWNDCFITISNVVPMNNISLPKAYPWVLDIPRQQHYARNKMLAGVAMPSVALEKKAEMDAGMSNEVADYEEVPAEFQQTAVRELPLAFEYTFENAITIESENKETLLPLFGRKLEGKYFYYSVPKNTQQTFLVSEVASSEELLSAPMSVFFADRYVGKTYLPAQKAGETFELNLGVDRGVIVKRQVIIDEVKETTFFGKVDAPTINRDMLIKITVENTKKEPVAVKVYDAIPVSRTDKIVVKDMAIVPEAFQQDIYDQKGVSMWKFALDPNETKEISIGFTVQYPKDVNPVGL